MATPSATNRYFAWGMQMQKAIRQALLNINSNIRQNQQNLERLMARADDQFLNLILTILTNEDAEKAWKQYTPSVHVYDESVSINVAMNRLESFKDPLLTETISDLLACAEWESETTDYPSSLGREFEFKTKVIDEATGLSAEYRVAINAYVKSDSPTCRRVMIGTETKVVEKYEIQCD